MRLHTYRARVLRVVDGDTLYLRIDLGFRLATDQRVRLLGVNTPEKRGEQRELGYKARIRVLELLRSMELRPAIVMPEESFWPVLVRTEKGDAFGRWLADVAVEAWDGTFSLGQRLLREGYAVPWDGRGQRPEPWNEDPAPYPYMVEYNPEDVDPEEWWT